ncbi:MAG: MmgE/PrpD family protein [Pseudomonadota bacterium]|nr:MmgE/PrpD family protein [Pseudomonadota bacterium]
MAAFGLTEFIHGLTYDEVPPAVTRQGKRCLIELAGFAAAGRMTRLSTIVHDYAAAHCGAGRAPAAHRLFDGRAVSRAGASFAGASTIDLLNAKEGHRLTKGHAGVALVPALVALAQTTRRLDGREVLTACIVGYEIATRTGLALHASASDYHTSGAWNATGVAAMSARVLGLSYEATRHAPGIAEYHGPRSQMMRCIDHPTIVKDASSLSALAGISAGDLAAAGFIGATALTVEAEPLAAIWAGLGARWRIQEQYFKPWPVCRWAQPAIEAVAMLMREHRVCGDEIERIQIGAFAEGARFGVALPATTEQAQYALGPPVTAMVVRGVIGVAEIVANGLMDPLIADMLARIEVAVDLLLSAECPARRRIAATLRYAPMAARGDPEEPLREAELLDKCRGLATGLGWSRRDGAEAAIFNLDAPTARADDLINLLRSGLDSVTSKHQSDSARDATSTRDEGKA